MKKLITILFMLIVLSSFGQQQYGDFKNINLRSRMYSNAYNLITAHPDSIGQFLYENAADPETDLGLVNLRFLSNNYMASEVVNDSINTKLEREIPIFWEEMEDPPLLVSDTISLVATQYYLQNYIDNMNLEKNVYSIGLISDKDVTDRVAGTITHGSGTEDWIIEAATNEIDLKVTHNLGRRVANVNVCTNSGGVEQVLRPFSTAYSAWETTDENTLVIQALATTPLPIKIYITFE